MGRECMCQKVVKSLRYFNKLFRRSIVFLHSCVVRRSVAFFFDKCTYVTYLTSYYIEKILFCVIFSIFISIVTDPNLYHSDYEMV